MQMKKPIHIKLLIVIVVLSLSAVFCNVGESIPTQDAATTTTPLTAMLSELQGIVQMQKAGGGIIQDAASGDTVEEQDIVLTQAESRARLDLSNGTIIRVGPMSHFTLETIEVRPDGAYARIQLTIGKLWIILNGGSMEIDTPSGLASVRGSFMHVWVDEETGEVVITCLEGECAMGNDAGTMTMHAGEMAVVTNSNQMPQMGEMSDAEVNEWLANNPEATLVVLPLTATAASTPTFTPTSAGAACSPPASWVAYSVQSGDTLINLAVKYGVPPDELLEKNCLDENASLEIGMTLYVPGSAAPSASTATRTPTATIRCGPPAGWNTYRIQSGDTLFSIATRFQTTVAALQQANCLGGSTTIISGQVLYVPNNPTITPTKTEKPTATLTPTLTETVEQAAATETEIPAETETLPKASETLETSEEAPN
jgi:LysM repeat protein